MTATITLKDLTSPRAIHAFNIALYRLSHNARYSNWSENKRVQYLLKQTFLAASNTYKSLPPSTAASTGTVLEKEQS